MSVFAGLTDTQQAAPDSAEQPGSVSSEPESESGTISGGNKEEVTQLTLWCWITSFRGFYHNKHKKSYKEKLTSLLQCIYSECSVWRH